MASIRSTTQKLMSIADALSLVLEETDDSDQESEPRTETKTQPSSSDQDHLQSPIKTLTNSGTGSEGKPTVSAEQDQDPQEVQPRSMEMEAAGTSCCKPSNPEQEEEVDLDKRFDIAWRQEGAVPTPECDEEQTYNHSPSNADESFGGSEVSTIDFNNSTTENASLPSNRLKRKPAPHTWRRNVSKQARLAGDAYAMERDGQKEARKLGPPCTSSFCEKSSLRQCNKLSAERREALFTAFWGMGSWDQRRTFVLAYTSPKEKRQNKVGEGSKRQKTINYYLKDQNGVRQQVCKMLFCSTLGMSGKTIQNWVREDDLPRPSPKQPVTRSGPHEPVSEEDMKFLSDWFHEIPSVPSHYCRKQKTYEGVKFIFPDKSLIELHMDYVNQCGIEGKRSVGRKLFNSTFKKLNFSMFVPRKDQCDTCIAAKLGNINKCVYEEHMNRKNNAQNEKANDKADTGPDTSVWTLDLQSVLTCPKTKASALYYKTKLTLHNMTYYNLKTKEAYNYIFDETHADLSSNMFGYLHYKHFKTFLTQNPLVKHLIIFSDGCGYQNKCSHVSNALLQLAVEQNVKIEQKFLVSGHTQMECDSVHSVIERKIRNCDLFTPSDYLVAIQMARQNPTPYEVTEINFTEPLRLSSDFVKSIRPGKKTSDPTVSNVCAYQYSADADGVYIKYKLAWGG